MNFATATAAPNKLARARTRTMQDADILRLPITRLVAAQARGELTAARILAAYVRRAREVDAACNCFTCWVPEAAPLRTRRVACR